MITAISKDGAERRELLYNETVLMVDKYDSLIFKMQNHKYALNYEFKFIFTDNGKEFSSDYELSENKRLITFTLNNWYSILRAENTNPVIIELRSGYFFWIKYGTSSVKEQSFRLFHLTVWGDQL